jgi:hypothetical protein
VTPEIRRSCRVVGLVGLLVAVGFAARLLIQHNGDPTIFTSFGEDAVAITEYAEGELGREVITRDQLGHDGRFFFVLANDPWLLDSNLHTSAVDRPRYRAQRMLYPMLAGGGGLLEGESIVWSLLIVNLLAMGLGTWGVADLASEMGGSPWWGLAFPLNVGLISEMNIDSAGVLAAAAAFWALVFLRRGRMGPGVALLTASALSREAMLIVAAGSAWWLWRGGLRRAAALAMGIPTGLVVAWAIYVRIRLGLGTDGAEIQEIGWPFVGLIEAFDGWLGDPVDLAAGLAILLLLALFTRRALLSSEVVGWALLGFVPLTFLLTKQVWLSYFDITRGIAPALTGFVLLVVLHSSSTDRRLPVPTKARP